MEKIIHRSEERGLQNHGWLKAAHSFSFANYRDPKKQQFGLLRVLNDDIIAPGKGFGTHGHDNMEIVTIPLKGILAHKDSLGTEGYIKPGEVQIMSAGTGIQHSEFNGSDTEELGLLQIWLFPKEHDIEPRYEQMRYDFDMPDNTFKLLVSPNYHKGTMWINQDAFFSIGVFESGEKGTYTVQHQGNGAYIFVIDGEAESEGTVLKKRDAMGVYEIESVDFKFIEKSKILVIEVPMV